MKKNLFLLIALMISATLSQAQNAHCGFDHHLEKMLEKDPSGTQAMQELNAASEEIKRARLNGDAERGGGPRIIPTVFHVIHNGGIENISKEQIEDQMRILNEDFQRLNADTVNTRAVFQDVAANPNVEFRLAKLDPQGNCTDGIVRVISPLTENASDESGVKGVSYWPSSDYFNVWVVKTIDNGGEQGTILGYAQFPGFGGASTDGVVVRADYIGDIGTGANNGSKGRTLTHEAGHWLGLFHTFQGGCSSGFFSDMCDDTPEQAEATPSNCPQNANTCTNGNPDLPDMVENYMDYSNGGCQNMYTLDQKDRMDGVLSGSRSNLHSQSNLNDTGVLLPQTTCVPKAQFLAERRIVCAGETIELTDNSYNGEVTTYNWTLPGTTTGSSSDQNAQVVYMTPGVYDVTLEVSNSAGSDTYTMTDFITVIPGEAQVSSWFAFEGFEETVEDYLVLSDDAGNTWEETNTAFTGSKSIYINNRNGNPTGSVDEFQLPSVDMTQINDPDLYFRLAHAQRSGFSDMLRIYVSSNCGESWSLRYNKSGASLSTVSSTQSNSFVPSSEADWELIDVNLGPYADKEHLLVKFQCTSDAGNNIYIDDIQITGSLGVRQDEVDFSFGINPNPMLDQAVLNLTVERPDAYRIAVNDVTGKLIRVVSERELSAGQHQFQIQNLNAGIYFISVEARAGRSIKKLVVQ